MNSDCSIVIGILLFVAVYLILSRAKHEMVLGVVLFSNAVNLLILVMSGSPEGLAPPILDESTSVASVDPLPQALILTAIVIGFGMVSFLITLVYKIQAGGTDARSK